MAEAARFITEHGFVGQGAPVLIRLGQGIATRFGIVVSQKVVAQAVPVIGALGELNEHGQERSDKTVKDAPIATAVEANLAATGEVPDERFAE
jgi:hypothetical protein